MAFSSNPNPAASTTRISLALPSGRTMNFNVTLEFTRARRASRVPFGSTLDRTCGDETLDLGGSCACISAVTANRTAANDFILKFKLYTMPPFNAPPAEVVRYTSPAGSRITPVGPFQSGAAASPRPTSGVSSRTSRSSSRWLARSIGKTRRSATPLKALRSTSRLAALSMGTTWGSYAGRQAAHPSPHLAGQLLYECQHRGWTSVLVSNAKRSRRSISLQRHPRR